MASLTHARERLQRLEAEQVSDSVAPTSTDDPAPRLANRNGCSEGQVGGHGGRAGRSSARHSAEAPGSASPGSIHPSNAHFGPSGTRRLDAGPSFGFAGCHDRWGRSASPGDHIEDERQFHGVMRKDRSARYGLRGSLEHDQFIADRRVLVREDDEPLQDTAQDSMSTTRSRRRRRFRPLPWSWDSDSELDGPLSRLRRVGLVKSKFRCRPMMMRMPQSQRSQSQHGLISQKVTRETEPAPSLLPTSVDMSRRTEVEAREPHRRRIMPGQGGVVNVRMEDESDDVVTAFERDLPVLSHTPTSMLTGRRFLMIPQTPGGTATFCLRLQRGVKRGS